VTDKDWLQRVKITTETPRGAGKLSGIRKNDGGEKLEAPGQLQKKRGKTLVAHGRIEKEVNI